MKLERDKGGGRAERGRGLRHGEVRGPVPPCNWCLLDGTSRRADRDEVLRCRPRLCTNWLCAYASRQES
ncbi:hypothetical protein T261_00652 [Streptomyces lydicus]|nr:hypothetical protein T261_00652 [Streptomyces lydicus]